jgi:DNA-directed RNA polymerase specialized sigma24 family protein
MSTKNRNLARLIPFTADEPIADAIDACLRKAVHGDREAIGRIATALGGFLYDEARATLGPRYEDSASDVVQNFYLGLLEERFTFPAIRGSAALWMKRILRMLAAEEVRRMWDRAPDPDSAA